MTIRFKCADCASVMNIKDELAGASARCPKCKTPFVVPESDHTDDSLLDSRELTIDPEGSKVAIPSVAKEAAGRNGEVHHVRSAAPDLSGADVVTTESKYSEGAPLALHDSNDDLDITVPPSDSDQDATSKGETAQIASKGTTETAELEDLDCPPMMLLDLLSAKPAAVSTPVDQAGRFKIPSILDEKVPESAVTTRPRSTGGAFDPLSFPASGRPVKDSDSHFKIELESSTESPRVSRPYNDRPAPVRKTYEPSEDLSLPPDSDDDLDVPSSQRPVSRPTPVPPPSRTTSEKVDLATAAKMMKKAIKESQSAEAHQREVDAKAGFDFAEFFREVGLKALAILLGTVMLTYMIYVGANRMYSGSLRLPKMGYVRGAISLDGKPLQGATVYFAPLKNEMEGSKKERIRTSVGTTNERGEFRMMYIPADRIEGVAVGECRVWITHVGNNGKSVVPIEWSEAARQTREVTEGNQKSPLDVKLVSKSR